MTTKTLREVCEEERVSRRAIQGYEEAGLITRAGKNKYGRLLYDSDTIGQIRLIKLLQDIGFSLKEIKTFVTASNKTKVTMLEEKSDAFEKTLEHMNRLQKEIHRLIREIG